MTFGKTARDAVISAITTTQLIGEFTYTIVVLDEQQKQLLPDLLSKIGLTYKWIVDLLIREDTIGTTTKRHYLTVLSLHLFCQQDDNDVSLEKKAYSLVDAVIYDLYKDLPSVLTTYDATLLHVGPVKPLWEVRFHREVAHLHFEVQIQYKQ